MGRLRQTYRVGYWIFSLGLGASVAGSVTWHVSGRDNPDASQITRVSDDVTPNSIEGRACSGQVQALYKQVRVKVAETFASDRALELQPIQSWETWSEGWRRELEQVRLSCRLDEREEMAPVALAATHVERLHMAYTTAIKGLTEVGKVPLGNIEADFKALKLND